MEEQNDQEVCSNCGESTDDNHLFNGVCLRVNADELPTFERTNRADWEGA